jgi:nucleoside 2-deoxyribosyltransferase
MEKRAMTVKAYLAGPDVFLPDAASHAKRKVEIYARYKIVPQRSPERIHFRS